MTKTQVKNYVAAGGGNCPFCGSASIECNAGYDVVDGREIAQEIECTRCKRAWREYYKLHDVEERDAEGELVDTTD